MAKKVAVAMSGGVDSSVAAALMVEKYGKENVFGITMRLFCYGEQVASEKSCCSLEAVSDAKKVCDQLGIRHYVLSFEKEFTKEVVQNFINEYEAGHTPNPCIRCNQLIKFEFLLKKARELGANILVTGHYARILEDYCSSQARTTKINSSHVRSNDKIYYLLKGKDKLKDQSYFLYTLTQDQLGGTEFPIGEMKKTETRKIASNLKLKTAEKTESQDICFVPGKVEDFLEERAAFEPGNIVDTKGNRLGEHRGLAFYTIGQRKGLGGGYKEIMYVVGINKDKNEVIIGPEEDLFSDELMVKNPQWITGEPKFPLSCTAKVRYQATEANCIVDYCSNEVRTKSSDSSRQGSNNSIKATFASPQKAITPGQSVVFYKEEVVLGGGIIV